MNASGPFGVDAVSAVFRVQKISTARRLHDERNPDGEAGSGSGQETPRKLASRFGTERPMPIRHGLWRHAPFVAQIIGQILPRRDLSSRIANATYGENRAITSTIDTQV